MSKSSAKDERRSILDAISKHPNSRFAKLFHEVDEAPSQKNIVMLLIELTQNKDFYVDFNIPLQYFLNLYEELDVANKEFLFNEAGLLIYNATQIYSRRVDCVQQRVEDQLAELSSRQESKEKNNTDEPTPDAVAEKPKRRKRLIETSDPYEIEIVSRKFRKLTPDKRFAPGTKIDTSKLFGQNLHTETYTHPALWQHAEIIDLDNDEEYDTKKNYSLFTSHIEHRYNTLVPDINFRLYFKMKDFMDEEDERDGESEFCQDNAWPPLSQAYVKRYIDLEDQVLSQDRSGNKRKKPNSTTHNNDDSGRNSASSNFTIQADSGIDSSLLPTSTDKIAQNDNIKRENIESIDSSLLQTNTDETARNENIERDNIKSIEESAGIENESIEPSLADSGISLSFLEENTKSQEQSSEMCSVDITTENSTENGNKNQEIPCEAQRSSENLIEDIQITALNLNSEQQPSDTAKPNVEENKRTEAVELNLSENIVNDMALTAKNSSMNAQIDSETIGTSAETTSLVEKKDEVMLAKQQLEEIKDGAKNNDIEETLEIIVHIENDNNQDCVSAGSCTSLSPTNDEGVYFSDIDDLPLTPYTIHLDSTALSELQENNQNDQKNVESYIMPTLLNSPKEWPITINILEFPPDVLRKMRKKLLLTSLGDDMELFLKTRCYKRTRTAADDPPSCKRIFKITRLFNSDDSSEISPPPSPQSDIDLLGFTEDNVMVTRHSEEVKISDIPKSPKRLDKNLRLSRDSGVGNDLLTATPEKNTMFFSPINEENNEVQRDIFGNNETNTIEILENISLTSANQVPLNESDKREEDGSARLVEQSNKEGIVEGEINTAIADEDCGHENISESDGKNNEEIIADTEKQFELSSNKTSVENEQSDINSLSTKDNPTATKTIFPTVLENSGSETPNINEKYLELSEDTAVKIQKWHKHLQPILANSRERHHFDVFEIGTNIIDKFDAKEGNRITFQNIMEPQDSSLVSRYFLSTLLLANQGNVELNVKTKRDDKPTEWHDLHLKLINTTRHVVSMEDNIGLAITKEAPTSVPKKPLTTSGVSKAMMQSPPAKKRCVSTLNVNLNKIEMVKPIAKIYRTSSDYDSGIYSNDEFDNL